MKEHEQLPDTTLILPVFNEEKRIISGLDAIDMFRQTEMHNLKCIIVDDGSEDNTLKLVLDYSISRPWLKVIRLGRNYGKGMAVRKGMEQNHSRFVFFMDADLSVPPETILTALPLLQQGIDMVIGSRRHPESSFMSRQGLLRRAIGSLGNIAIRRATGLPHLDTQCGFKGFNRDCAMRIFPNLKTEGYLFDVEALLLAREKGFSIREIPVRWTHVAGGTFSPFSDSIKALAELGRIARRHAYRCT